MKQKLIQQGFTMIELMIVVAIIGILAAIAIMTFEEYSLRSKVKEGLDLAGPAKAAVSEFFSSKSRLPANNASVGIPSAASIFGNYVTNVTINHASYPGNGVITIQLANDNALTNKEIVLTPTANSGDATVRWNCTGGDLEDRYRPAECR